MKKIIRGLLLSTFLSFGGFGFATQASADPITAAIATTLNAVGFTAAGGAAITGAMVGNWVIGQAVGIGMSVLSTVLAAKPRQEGGGISTSTTQSGADKPRTIILGHYATGGHLITESFIYDIDKNDNKYYTQVIGLSDTRLSGLDEIVLNGKAYVPSPQVSPGQPGYHFDDGLGQRLNGGDVEGRAMVRFYDGTQTTADPTLITISRDDPRPVNTNFKMTGVSYMIFTAKHLNENPKFTKGVAPIAVVRGRPLYDPRKDSSNGYGSGSHRWGQESTYEFTANPVIMIYNILRGITLGPNQVYGAGAKAADLPLNYWIPAANVCDEPGTQPNSTNWKDDIKRYRAGIEIAVDQEPLQVIEALAKTCGAQISRTSGSYVIAVGPPSAPVAHVTDGEIVWDSVSHFQMSDGINSRFNAVTATYPNPKALWKTNPAEEFKNDGWIEGDGKYRPVALALETVPFPAQVRRIMREVLSDSRRLRNHSIVLPATYAGLNVTDTITWTSITNGYQNKLFEVTEVVLDTANLSVKVSIRERDPEDYDFDAVSDNILPFQPDGSTYDPAIVGVPDFTVSPYTQLDSNGRSRKAGIRLNWNPEVSYSGILYQVRLQSDNSLVTTGAVQDTAYGSALIFEGLLPTTSYIVRAKASKPGYPNIAWGGWLPVTTDAVFIGRDDIADDILEDLDDAVEWITEHTNIREEFQEEFDRIDGENALIRADIISNKNSAENAIDAVRDEVMLEVGEARNFANTLVYDAKVELSSNIAAVAAQVTALSAAYARDELILNGSFADGLSNWTTSGTSTVVAKNPSGNALLASMPAPFAVQIANGGASITQEFNLNEFTESDKLTIQLLAGSIATTSSASREVRINVVMLNASGTAIGAGQNATIMVRGGSVWRAATADFDIAVGAVEARITFTHVTAGSVPVLLTLISGSFKNTSQIARIDALEVASINQNASIVALTEDLTTKYDDTIVRIGNVITAQANTDAGLILRIANSEINIANSQTKISNLELSVANTNGAMASLENETFAKFGAEDIIRDSIFTRNRLYWSVGTMPFTVTPKEIASTDWRISAMPAQTAAAFNINADPATLSNIASAAMPVTPGEVFDVSFDYARNNGGSQVRVDIRFRSASGLLGNPVANRAETTLHGTWQRGSIAGVVVPATAVTAQIYIHPTVAASGDPVYVTNVTAKRRVGFSAIAAAGITTLEFTVANTNASLASLTSNVSAQFTAQANVNSAVANNISNRWTIAEANAAISAASTAVKAELNPLIGAKANSSAVTALSGRVANTESGLIAVSKSITDLNSELDVVVDDVALKANSSALTTLNTRVNNIAGNVSAISDSLTSISSSIGRISAGGKLRLTTAVTPTGAQSRIGLHAEASDGASTHSAGLFLVAESNGTTSTILNSQRIAFVTNDTPNAPRTVPLIVVGNQVRMTGAFIADLSVDRLRIQDNAVTVFHRAYTASGINGSGSGLIEIQRLVLNKGRNDYLPMYISASYAGRADLQLQRNSGSGWTTVWASSDAGFTGSTWSSGSKSGDEFTFIDKWTGTGSVTYRLMGRAWTIVSQASSGGRDYYKVGLASPFTQRFLAAFNVFK